MGWSLYMSLGLNVRCWLGYSKSSFMYTKLLLVLYQWIIKILVFIDDYYVAKILVFFFSSGNSSETLLSSKEESTSVSVIRMVDKTSLRGSRITNPILYFKTSSRPLRLSLGYLTQRKRKTATFNSTLTYNKDQPRVLELVFVRHFINTTKYIDIDRKASYENKLTNEMKWKTTELFNKNSPFFNSDTEVLDYTLCKIFNLFYQNIDCIVMVFINYFPQLQDAIVVIIQVYLFIWGRVCMFANGV